MKQPTDENIGTWFKWQFGQYSKKPTRMTTSGSVCGLGRCVPRCVWISPWSELRNAGRPALDRYQSTITTPGSVGHVPGSSWCSVLGAVPGWTICFSFLKLIAVLIIDKTWSNVEFCRDSCSTTITYHPGSCSTKVTYIQDSCSTKVTYISNVVGGFPNSSHTSNRTNSEWQILPPGDQNSPSVACNELSLPKKWHCNKSTS